MYGMSEAQNAVMNIAKAFAENDLVMSVNSLVDTLNKSNVANLSGNPFVENGRGVYRLISTTYERLDGAGETLMAEAVANTFVTPDGFYAYAEAEREEANV